METVLNINSFFSDYKFVICKNMIVKEPILLFIAICLLSSIITARSSKYCDRSCGNKFVPFPFGFSADCQIPLNCSSSNQQLIGGFPIFTINADRMKISIEATCDRPLEALHRLYGPGYAPSSRNAILLQNCSLPKPCMIPTTTVYTHFEAIGCSSNDSSISCYSENKTTGFLDYDKVTRTNCKSFLSSISAESFDESGVLEVQMVELGWWLQGRCPDYCSENAFCDEIVPPFNGQPGFRCRCKNGFIGDGYRAGHGCRKGQFFLSSRITLKLLEKDSQMEKATALESNGIRWLQAFDCAKPVLELTTNQDASVATDRIGKGRLDELIDPFLEPNSDSWTLSSIHKVAELAFRCLSFQRDMRPTMMEVALELEQIRLSRCAPAEEITCATSSEVSPCSSSSNISEQPLSMAVNNKDRPENKELFMLEMTNVGCMNLIEKLKDNSPVSTKDSWLSEQSSPSSSSLLNSVNH
ncbi:wall-associated receptor kinase-like 14 [Hibiscus syriacus]|uniref:wall-associated receptor kinase-like 14 n=1 Tax=Hibiscus syriacus TaxID=106335 RepID=UPI001921747B|nr:wall-associated receptor kinase-like 14 [Hibiscus syriacus]